MVQAFDGLVMRRTAFALAAVTLLTGCQCFSPVTSEEEVSEEEAETAMEPGGCPYVTEAEAWVNRMPSIGSSPAKLIVSLRVAGQEPWMLKPAEAGEGELVLEVAPGGNSVPGTVAYRQAQPSPLPEAIRIMCAGDEIARIDEILMVQ